MRLFRFLPKNLMVALQGLSAAETLAMAPPLYLTMLDRLRIAADPQGRLLPQDDICQLAEALEGEVAPGDTATMRKHLSGVCLAFLAMDQKSCRAADLWPPGRPAMALTEFALGVVQRQVKVTTYYALAALERGVAGFGSSPPRAARQLAATAARLLIAGGCKCWARHGNLRATGKFTENKRRSVEKCMKKHALAAYLDPWRKESPPESTCRGGAARDLTHFIQHALVGGRSRLIQASVDNDNPTAQPQAQLNGFSQGILFYLINARTFDLPQLDERTVLSGFQAIDGEISGLSCLAKRRMVAPDATWQECFYRACSTSIRRRSNNDQSTSEATKNKRPGACRRYYFLTADNPAARSTPSPVTQPCPTPGCPGHLSRSLSRGYLDREGGLTP